MRKNITCLSRSISFVTANFLFFLRVSLLPALLFALFLTVAFHALWASFFFGALISFVLAIVAFMFVQGIVISMWRVKEKGLAVDAQKTKSLYRLSLKKITNGFNPIVFAKRLKYCFKHFYQIFSLSICCLCVYLVLLIVVCLPVIAIIVIQWTVDRSVNMGDVVNLPDGLGVTFFIVTFVVSYTLSAILSPSILPYMLRKKECDKEDAELEEINIK
jgi:hypothetical protein